MNIDRVAKAMTGGRPRAGFTARVMAPIDGRPAPGFTARVMQGIEKPVAPGFTVGRSFSSGISRALILSPAAIALAAGALLLTRGAVRTPALPGAPKLATNAANVRIPLAPPMPDSVAPSRITHVALPWVSPTAAEPEASPIYQIAALEGPAAITSKDIQPAACTIPALDAPAPLKLPDLSANGGGSQKEFKE